MPLTERRRAQSHATPLSRVHAMLPNLSTVAAFMRPITRGQTRGAPSSAVEQVLAIVDDAVSEAASGDSPTDLVVLEAATSPKMRLWSSGAASPGSPVRLLRGFKRPGTAPIPAR